MAELNIPTEIKDVKAFPQLKKIDRQIICAAVLMGLPNQDAFLLHHPEYVISTGKGKYRISDAGAVESKHFWSYSKNREYREQYEKELAEFLGRKQTNRSENNEPTDKRRDKALDKLVSDCLDAIDSNSSLDPEILKDFVAMAKALGVLKEETERQIPALRFLPERCFSSCRYRLFVENAVKGGDLINDCDYCRALRFARENGFKGDDTNILDLPKEVLDAEPENTVSTLDILAGKIDN